MYWFRAEIVAALPLFTLRPLADMDPATTPIIPSLLRNTLVYGPSPRLTTDISC